MCILSNAPAVTQNKTYEIIMLAMPVVSITPMTSVARVGDNVTLTCTASVQNTGYNLKKPPHIFWFRDQTALGSCY